MKPLPPTFGQTKVISTSKVLDKIVSTSFLQNAKRKFDETNPHEDECSKQDEKKLAGIDYMLIQYEDSSIRTSLGSLPTSSSSSSSSSSDQSQETESSYFSSNKSKTTFKSPILNKVKNKYFEFQLKWV